MQEIAKHVMKIALTSKQKVPNDLIHFLQSELIESEGLFFPDRSFKNSDRDHILDLCQKHTDFNKKLADKILTLYFIQLKNPHGVLLNIGLDQFKVVNVQANGDFDLLFSATRPLYVFDESFLNALKKLYVAFYLDDSLFEVALKEMGLTRELSDTEARGLAKLFRDNFLQVGETKFSLIEFERSFLEIFQFFVDHKVKLPTDYVFLGFYLISLYTCLDDLDVALDSSKVFEKVFNRYSQ